MDAALSRAREFVRWTPSESERLEVSDWLHVLDDNSAKASRTAARAQAQTQGNLIRERFGSRIAFGTAGLRALMAPGYNTINSLVVLQTTQGLCRYAQENIMEFAKKGAVIGFDGRHNSALYASIVASVFLSQDIKVLMFKEMVATPLVPFGISQLHAGVGVMVTASHNPKDDNGYKVYWENGAQIIPPHDEGIANSILSNLEPWCQYSLNPAHELLSDPTAILSRSYIDLIQQQCCFHRSENASSLVPVVYTAMHGVGASWVSRAFKAFDLPPYVPVTEQVQPDPEFPTVKFPNPEEGKGALALAIETANESKADLILANDPDADRLAVAERLSATEWKIFNGNEIAALLADWVWTHYKSSAKEDELGKSFMVASTVSSKFLKAMAEAEGFHFEDTLTGFKWLANASIDLEKRGYKFLFAYEVEIGFLISNISMDKDGVRTAAVVAEMAAKLKQEGKTCNDHLQELFAKYGYFVMKTSYFFCASREVLDNIFERMRTGGADGGYIRSFGDAEVTSIRDVTTGYDDSKPDNKSSLPLMPNDHMLTFHFSNGCLCTIRNSGTEPKLKYYVEANDPKNAEVAQKKLQHMTELILEHLIRPDLNHLSGPAQAD